jgi:hypothetical protein
MSVVTEMYREWYFGGFSDCGEGVIFVAGEASILRCQPLPVLRPEIEFDLEP